MQRAATKKDWKTCPMPEKNERHMEVFKERDSLEEIV